MQNRSLLCCLALCLGAAFAATANAERHVLSPDDYYQLVDVTDPQVAPDGSQIAYVVTESDRTAEPLLTWILRQETPSYSSTQSVFPKYITPRWSCAMAQFCAAAPYSLGG